MSHLLAFHHPGHTSFIDLQNDPSHLKHLSHFLSRLPDRGPALILPAQLADSENSKSCQGQPCRPSGPGSPGFAIRSAGLLGHVLGLAGVMKLAQIHQTVLDQGNVDWYNVLRAVWST